MNEWARLVDRYAGELKKFEMVCAFCGQHLCEENVNAECAENQQQVLKGRATQSQNSIQMASDMGQSMYFTEIEPPLDLIGKRRHFFGRSSKAATSSVIGSAMRSVEGVVPQQTEINNNGLLIIRELLSNADCNKRLLASFKNLDYAQSGFVTKDDFVNILFENSKDCQYPAQLLKVV